MMQPLSLKQGDKIGIVSTARKITSEEIQTAVKVFEDWGLEVIIGNTIGQSYHQFAGTDEERAKDLQQMLDDKDIKTVICARGGYGTVKLIDRLNFDQFKNDPKWIVGYSDVTALHAHIHTNFSIATLHATMPLNFSDNTEDSLNTLKKALFGEALTYQFTSHPFNRIGEADGVLVGGNLSVLYSLSGSKSDIDTKGKLLFLEDLDEYLYHIDRMMTNLKRAGKLDRLAALLVGGFTEMNDNEVPYGQTAEEIIKDAVKEYDYPVAFGFSAGHEKENLALKLGKTMLLKVEKTVCQLR